jgi:hypothetical protein
MTITGTDVEFAEVVAECAQELRKAKVAEATAFLMAKASNLKLTDGSAERQAIVATDGRAITAQAAYDIALISFQKG